MRSGSTAGGGGSETFRLLALFASLLSALVAALPAAAAVPDLGDPLATPVRVIVQAADVRGARVLVERLGGWPFRGLPIIGGFAAAVPAVSLNVLGVKVADAFGATDVSQVVAAVDWVVQHRQRHGLNIRVLNLAFGIDSGQAYRLDPLAHAVGEQDIFGRPWDGPAWTQASSEGRSWSAGWWNGSAWAGTGFAGGAWEVVAWEAPAWSARSWAELAWSGRRGSGEAWSGDSWWSNAWAGRRWTSVAWSAFWQP